MVYILGSRVSPGFDHWFWPRSIHLRHCPGVGFREKSSYVMHLHMRSNCRFNGYAPMAISVTYTTHA